MALATGVFGEHGYEGTSTAMLVQAMGIGRQSLYDTFGDKRGLYLAALQAYARAECAAHLAALHAGPRAIDGLAALLERVVGQAGQPCLGVSATCEFGCRDPEVNRIRDLEGKVLRAGLVKRLRQAQAEADLGAGLEPGQGADFLVAGIAALRLSARSGASGRALKQHARLLLRALA